MLDSKVYVAHPYSFYERDKNENTNGLIRQYFPKDCDFTAIFDNDIQQLQNRL
jgi:IS30 family transposase